MIFKELLTTFHVTIEYDYVQIVIFNETTIKV